MEISKKKYLIEEHFPGEVEMLPKSTIDALLNEENVEVIKVSGSSQLDLLSVIAIIKLALDCIKFIYETFINHKEKAVNNAEVIAVISKKYPQILDLLGTDGIKAFVHDICSK